MDESTLISLLDEDIRQAVGYQGGKVSEFREQALDYYLGEPFGNEVTGRSAVVTREVLECIEWRLPSLMRIFASGNRIVQFDPVGPEDEDAADQETDYVNYVVTKENNGFKLLHDWFKDCLMYRNGVVKVWWDEQEEITKEDYTNLTELELQAILADDEVEITGQTVHEGIDPLTQQPIALFDINLKRTQKKGRVNIENVPPEEILVDKDASSTDLKKCRFICHETKKTISDLLEMGYDRKIVETLHSQNDRDYDDERWQRRERQDDYITNQENSDQDPSQREVWIQECYKYIDWDGDGIGEFRKIVKVGSTVLENDEFDGHPLISMTPIPMPHQYEGMCDVDLTSDIQKVNSTLLRQSLDNLYNINNGRVAAGQGVNLEDLLTPRPQGVVRCQDVSQVKELTTTSVFGQTLPMLEYMSDQKERRTGISRNTMGSDPDVLSRSTQGAFNTALEQSSLRTEMYARVFAETGVKDLMLRVHELLIKHQDKAKVVKLRNKWVEINPSEWRTRTDMSVVVGVGTGNKDQILSRLWALAEKQEQHLLNGSPLVTPENLYNTYRKIIENSDLKDVALYFTDPDTVQQQPQQPQPDASMEAIKAQLMIEQGKNQVQEMKIQMDAQTKAMQEHSRQMVEAMKLQFQQQQQDQKDLLDKYKADLASATDLAIKHMEQLHIEAQPLRQ